MFDWFFQIEKKFEGKWKGKGTIINKDSNNKLTKKCILTKLIIKKINNFSYKVYIKNLIEKNYTNLELIGFITPFSVKFRTLKRCNCTHKGVIILDPIYLLFINLLFNVISSGLLSFVNLKDLLYFNGLSLNFM